MIPPLGRRRLLAGSAALPLAGEVQAQSGAKRPNIVFILADDMGYADIGCYGRPDLATPNIDRIAAEGVRFTQAYANSPVCTASRVAIITGRYQCRLPVGLEEPIAPITHKDVGLPPEHPTLPSLLKRAGYGTTLIGKWHLGGLPAFGPLKSGYDHFYGYRSGAIDYYRHSGTNGEPDFWDDDRPLSQDGYATDLFGDHAVRVISEYARAGQPFLLSLHFNAPHWPREARGDQAESDRLRGTNLRDWDGGGQATYRAMIAAMDEQVGRVQAALTEAGIARDTITVFTSDNGGERFSDTWPFTGRKTELLEGGLRIPALISWPAGLPAGRVSEQVTANMDWLPTLLAAAGTVPDPAYPPDGMNLLPHLAEGAPMTERRLFWRYKSLWQRAARVADWKYLKILEDTFLFDVVADPLERANMKDRRRDVYDALVAAWGEWNAQMLPEVGWSFTEDFDSAHMADRIGLRPASLTPDPSPGFAAGGGAAGVTVQGGGNAVIGSRVIGGSGEGGMVSRREFPLVATLTVLVTGIVACVSPRAGQAEPCPPPICATAEACRRAADWVVEGRVLEYLEGGYGRSCHITLPFLSEACRFPAEPPTVLLDHAIEVRGRSDLVSQGVATLPQAAACPLPVMAQTGPIQPPDLGSAMVGQQYRFYGFGGGPGSPSAVYVFAEPVAGASLRR